MSEMNDLISREELLKEEATIEGYSSVRFVLVDDIMTAPSADIMECARAIKEYCKKYAENCEGCPFKSKKVDVWCELGCSSLPYEWDLPEPYKKGGERMTREEAIAYGKRVIDLGLNDETQAFCNLAISALSENKGEWIKVQSGDKDFPESIVCSKCRNENSHFDFNEHAEPIGKVFVTSKFCPNCGADMRGKAE